MNPIDLCLDTARMRDMLAAWLPGAPDIAEVRILQARRSASKRRHPHPLTAVYELALRDGRTQRWYAKTWRDGASLAALPVSGPATVAVPPLDMLLWPWPADPGLPQLRELLDARRALTWRGDAPAAVDVLRWEPEQRATLRYAQAGATLYAKTFADDRGAHIHERFRHVWTLAQQEPAAPAVAEPLRWHAATRSVWQARAPGVPLPDLLAGSRTGDLPGRLARALAALHGCRIAGVETRHDLAHWTAEAWRRARKLGRALPMLADRAARVADVLERSGATLPDHEPGLIHGDFHAGQVGVDVAAGGRIVFHDFDEFALGDPMEDLAAFVTRLPARPDFGAALTAAYAEAAPHRFGRERLRWHRALQALLQASRAFVFQLPGWPAEAERRLARAETLAAPDSAETLA